MTANDIILPDPKTLSDNIREACNIFLLQAEKEWGITFNKTEKDVMETVFVVGYCAGHNDAMDCIMGQQIAVDIMKEIINQKNQ